MLLCAWRAKDSQFTKLHAKLCLEHSLAYPHLLFIVNIQPPPVSLLRDPVRGCRGEILRGGGHMDGGVGNLAHQSHRKVSPGRSFVTGTPK